MPRRASVVACPEVDEAKHLVCLFAFADVGIRVAEDLTVGILRQEGQDARLATAAFAEIMGLHEGMLAEVGYGVEVEVEGFPRQDRFAGERSAPGAELGCDFLRG